MKYAAVALVVLIIVIGCSRGQEHRQDNGHGVQITGPQSDPDAPADVEVVKYELKRTDGQKDDEPEETADRRGSGLDSPTFARGEAFDCDLVYSVDDPDIRQHAVKVSIIYTKPDGSEVIMDQGGGSPEKLDDGKYRLAVSDLELHDDLRPGGYTVRAQNNLGVLWEKRIKVTK